jgi:hypothetical protein
MAVLEPQDDLNCLNSLSNWFDQISREITVVQIQINQKNGFWFFTRHIYSQEELLNSPIFNKINAMTQNIGYNLDSWAKYGKLGKYTQDFYTKKRDEVSSKLNQTNALIARREPTWWEKVGDFFESATKFILQNLPLIVDILEKNKHLLPKIGGKLKMLPKIGD